MLEERTADGIEVQDCQMIPMRVSKSDTNSTRALYEGDRVKRDLLIIIDADTVRGDPEGTKANDLLLGLATYEHVKMYRYADDGPPPGTPTLEPEFWEPSAIGWLVSKESDPEGLTSHTVTYSDGHHITNSAIVGGLVPRFAQKVGSASAGVLAEQLERDSLMLMAASEIGADILVTARPTLLSARPFETPETITVASPAEAIPMLGLYVRSRGDYVATKTARVAITFNKGLYWQRSSELYIPNLLNVTARTEQLAQATGTPTLGLLAFAVQRRLARVFERRDGIWRLIDQKQDRDIAEDTLTAVDALLTFLMSASDALAKVADGVLVTNIAPKLVAWQRGDWLRAITKKDAELGALFDASAQPAQALKVLRLLRNCIHDEGLDAVAVQASSRTRETWIVLPASQAADITDAMIKLEPLETWGVHDGLDGSRYAEVGPLIETLLVGTLAALSSAIDRLAEILETRTTTPNFGPESQFNEALLSLHMQWQVGLGEPWPDL
ncbi:hypothetical protein E3T46_05655 [Cryobacterium sp. Hh11]|uniref:hypothetical protein n=1 Tax=Cryobacterium sp. Hh11 TaxID=2555868 RepID=UPI001069ABB0|nr:hypothetical protein [Cryobacterium sp. Hh11]TFD52353.1 hypothetical protein E3T46_05655 [Cryobacterium sp. Hh11]